MMTLHFAAGPPERPRLIRFPGNLTDRRREMDGRTQIPMPVHKSFVLFLFYHYSSRFSIQ
jgi:hypothetical protein